MYFAGEVAIAGVGEGFDFDNGFLSLADEADVFVEDERFDVQLVVVGDDDQERLRRSYHAADGMRRQLLYGSADRRGEAHQALALLCLVQLCAQLCALFVCLTQGIEGVAADGLGVDGAAVFRFVYRCLDLFALVALAFEVVLVFDQFAFLFEVGVVGDEVLFDQFVQVASALAFDAAEISQFVNFSIDYTRLGFVLTDTCADLLILCRPSLILVAHQ